MEETKRGRGRPRVTRERIKTDLNKHKNGTTDDQFERDAAWLAGNLSRRSVVNKFYALEAYLIFYHETEDGNNRFEWLLDKSTLQIELGRILKEHGDIAFQAAARELCALKPTSKAGTELLRHWRKAWGDGAASSYSTVPLSQDMKVMNQTRLHQEIEQTIRAFIKRRPFTTTKDLERALANSQRKAGHKGLE